MAGNLKVSASTISKALRDSDDISDDMKTRVRNEAAKHGYRPNLLAQTLINKRSRLIGALIPDLRISFFSQAARGMYEEANKKHYETILLVHDEKKENEQKKLEFLSDIHVDGILLNTVGSKQLHPLYRHLAEEGIQIVCWDRRVDGMDFKHVTIDDKKASFELTARLIADGRKNIIFWGPTTGIPVAKDRYEGYVCALTEFGIPLNKRLLIETFRNTEDSYKKMTHLIEEKVVFDGLISIGGLITYGAGKSLLDHGIRIPDDVVLGEFGDNDVVSRLKVPFYTVYQNPYKIGRSAVDLVIRMIESNDGDSKFDNIIVDSEVLLR
jgi:DNA-binding LacI/PurR family transcriptional regulator